MKICVICVESGTGKHAAFSPENPRAVSTGHSAESAVVAFIREQFPDIEIVEIDHYSPRSPKPSPSSPLMQTAPVDAGLIQAALPQELSFQEAMQYLKAGKKVSRGSWPKGSHLEFGPHAPRLTLHCPAIDGKPEVVREWPVEEMGSRHNHLNTEQDRNARDWMVV